MYHRGPHHSPCDLVRLGRVLRLARKELTEILRDRRTILTLLVMPLLLYPLLTIGFGRFGVEKAADEKTIYRLGFSSKQAEKALTAYMVRRDSAPELRAGIFADLDEAVRGGEIDVGFRPRSADATDMGRDWDLVYRPDSPNSRDALRFVEKTLATSDAEHLRNELGRRHFAVPQPLRFQPVPLVVPTPAKPTLIVFVPLVLILMTITGAVYPAIDLTAGERERGTLEMLLAAPVPRVSLLFGKYIAVLTVSVLTALMNIGSMTLSLWVSSRLFSGFAERAFGPGGIQALPLLAVFGLVLLFAAFFSAVLLVLTSFAQLQGGAGVSGPAHGCVLDRGHGRPVAGPAFDGCTHRGPAFEHCAAGAICSKATPIRSTARSW